MADARKLEAQLEPAPSPQLHDESADPRLRELIYRAGSVIRLRVEDADWVWDVFIRVQDGDETRLGGLPIKPGELYPLLVMENLGRAASRFMVASMCARASAAGAIVTTETTELFDELQALVADVVSNGVLEANIKYGLDKKLARKLKDLAAGRSGSAGRTAAAPAAKAVVNHASADGPATAHVSRSQSSRYCARRRPEIASMVTSRRRSRLAASRFGARASTDKARRRTTS